MIFWLDNKEQSIYQEADVIYSFGGFDSLAYSINSLSGGFTEVMIRSWIAWWWCGKISSFFGIYPSKLDYYNSHSLSHWYFIFPSPHEQGPRKTDTKMSIAFVVALWRAYLFILFQIYSLIGIYFFYNLEFILSVALGQPTILVYLQF